MSHTVLVTGGTGGIGRAVAQRFAASGARVTITGRKQHRTQLTAEQLGIRGIVCDVTEPDSVQHLAECFSDIDVIVSAAGGIPAARPQSNQDVDLRHTAASWWDSYTLNTVGPVMVVTALLPKMNPGGSIITISSIGAEAAGHSYGTAKAAVAAWTAGISAKVGPQGHTANAISPGYIEDTDFFGESMTEQRRQRLIEATHNKRAGRPDDVAGLAFFLASEDARHITGQTIHINGGAYTTR